MKTNEDELLRKEIKDTILRPTEDSPKKYNSKKDERWDKFLEILFILFVLSPIIAVILKWLGL